MKILGKYVESEEEKRISYLRRKLLQWNETSKKLTTEIEKSKVAKWIADKFKISRARKQWKDLVDKYDMFKNNSLLWEVRRKLINGLRLRDMSEKIRNRLTVVGLDQFKEGIEFKKILVLMRTLFENWEERNKFLAKRFFTRKWYMQVKKLKERDATFDKALGILDKKSLTDNVNTLTDVSQANRILKAVNAARAVDFFTHLRRIWGDWDKVRRRILAIMGKYLESEEDKRINYLRRKLLQWKDKAKKVTSEVQSSKLARWIADKYKLATARKNRKEKTRRYFQNGI